jgi:hypothetical protein
MITKTWDQRLFTLLWIWISFRTILPWLVFFRLTFEGNSYSWGTDYFGRMFYSSGLARADFLVIYALLAMSLFLLFQLRKQNFKLIAPVLVVYLGFFAADALYALLRGEPIIFQGDTLGVTVNLSTPFFVLQFGMFVVAIAWWLGVRDIATGPGPQPMARYKRVIVKICIAIVPLQLLLLIFGEPHELTDEIGVILTILQWIMLAFAFYPGAKYRVT